MDADVPLQPEWIVGNCPECGGLLIENLYYKVDEPDRDQNERPLQTVIWTAWLECWNALGPQAQRSCGYRVPIPIHPGLF